MLSASSQGAGGTLLLRLHPLQRLILTPGASPAPMPALPFLSALSGLSLNSLTILSFCKTPELRTPSHLLVLSLALADSGISLNAFVAATSSLLRYHPSPQSLGSGAYLWALGSRPETFFLPVENCRGARGQNELG